MNTTIYSLTAEPWSVCQAQCSRIRRDVFIIEQGVSEADEWDQLDETAVHLIIYERGSSLAVACARLITIAGANAMRIKITRMAVTRSHRRQGLGTALVRAALKYAAQGKSTTIELNAQMQAVPFYTALGFAAVEQPFWDAGIEHIRMVNNLV